MDDDAAEAEAVAIRISAARFERQVRWRDFAVLYRSNQQARIVEQALRDLRIPYTISGGQSFFEKPEVRDILAYLRLIANDDDDRSEEHTSELQSLMRTSYAVFCLKTKN